VAATERKGMVSFIVARGELGLWKDCGIAFDRSGIDEGRVSR
jgi:hypothetical protein